MSFLADTNYLSYAQIRHLEKHQLYLSNNFVNETLIKIA